MCITHVHMCACNWSCYTMYMHIYTCIHVYVCNSACLWPCHMCLHKKEDLVTFLFLESSFVICKYMYHMYIHVCDKHCSRHWNGKDTEQNLTWCRLSCANKNTAPGNVIESLLSSMWGRWGMGIRLSVTPHVNAKHCFRGQICVVDSTVIKL